MTLSAPAAADAALTIVAATDLMSGSRTLYTIAVAVLVFFVLIASGFRAVASLAGGRIGEAVGAALIGIILAVIIGSSYAIYVSTKRTADQTGITTGQFG